jgi:hypothetical protein
LKYNKCTIRSKSSFNTRSLPVFAYSRFSASQYFRCSHGCGGATRCRVIYTTRGRVLLNFGDGGATTTLHLRRGCCGGFSFLTELSLALLPSSPTTIPTCASVRGDSRAAMTWCKSDLLPLSLPQCFWYSGQSRTPHAYSGSCFGCRLFASSVSRICWDYITVVDFNIIVGFVVVVAVSSWLVDLLFPCWRSDPLSVLCFQCGISMHCLVGSLSRAWFIKS